MATQTRINSDYKVKHLDPKQEPDQKSKQKIKPSKIDFLNSPQSAPSTSLNLDCASNIQVISIYKLKPN